MPRRVCAALVLSVLAFPVYGAAHNEPSAKAPAVKSGWQDAMAAARDKVLLDGGEAVANSSFFQPYDTGPMRGDGPAQRISISVSGVKELRLLASCEQGTANCNIWGEPKLFDKDGRETRLTALKPTRVTVGWGEMLTDKNWQNHPLHIGDQKFEFGIWVHADSEIIYALGGKYERFEAYVGEDKDRANGMLRFRVLSGEQPKLPACWVELNKAYPEACGWLREDVGTGGILAWFGKRDGAKMECDLIGGLVKKHAADVPAFPAEMDELARSNAPAGDARWLGLYARVCRYRQANSQISALKDGTDKSALKKELADLATAKASPADPRWAEACSRAVSAREIDRQFEALQIDLRNRSQIAGRAKETFRPESLILDGDRDPLDVVLRRTAALLADLKNTPAGPKLSAQEEQLEKLKKCAADTPVTDAASRRTLFSDVSRLRRQIAFSNPLLNFSEILFIKRHRSIYNHMCDQFYGMAQMPGGGLYILSDAFGSDPKVRDVLAGSTVVNGRLKGQALSGGRTKPWGISYDGVGNLHGEETEGGSFLSPDLSFDGKEILFAYVECRGDRKHRHHMDPSRGHWEEGRCYHPFKVNVDGSGLTQLTDGTWNEFDPCWLPNGRVAFISERRGGYLRCGRACPNYTLYDVAADGTGVNCLSFHETNEWNPSVTNDGRIIYTRWDYVDRHGCTAHHPWITTLDGTDSRAVHGNFSPRNQRADMEVDCQAVPDSHKFIATAAPHHGQAWGSLILIDPRVPDDDVMAPVKRVTPEVGFPESQGGGQVYGTPWPLSENYYLCVYDASMQPGAGQQGGGFHRGDYGIYLVDAFGNKDLVYRDPEIGCLSPIPLRARTKPPATPSPSLPTASNKPIQVGDPGEATMLVMDVYNSLKPWPKDADIKAIRVYQVLPMPMPSGGGFFPHETGQRIASAGDSVVPARWVLGTVPVESDGSAHFKVPANRELFFQALDSRGLAVQSMRSATYVRSGERLSCQGCHEPKSHAPAAPKGAPLALKREPSTITPDVEGSNPFSYPKLVQPVLEKNCIACHEKNKGKAPNLAREPMKNRWFASYNSLLPYAFTDYKDSLRTTPGNFGARASKLFKMLEKGHHEVKLTPEDLHRITLWLDTSSMFYGVYEKEGGEAMLRGEDPKPTLE